MTPLPVICILLTYFDETLAAVPGRPADALELGTTPVVWKVSETAVRAMSMADIASETLERMM